VTEFLVPLATFVCLVAAASAGAAVGVRMASRRADGDTVAIVRLAVNIFVVITSVVVGLMLNSAKNTFETNNRNNHALATEIILLDRNLRTLGPEAGEARRDLADYLRTGLGQGNILDADRRAEAALDAAGASLRSIKAPDGQRLALWNDARELYRQVVRERWIFVDAAGGAIPAPLIVALVAWLAAVFAGLGFGAPRNGIVAATFVATALMLSSALYLVLEMDRPTSGLIGISNAPFERALAEVQR